MTSLREFLNSEFCYASPNLQVAELNAKKIEKQVGNKTIIVRVKGNGNCLPKSIITNMLLTRNEDVMFNILESFVDFGSLLQIFENRNLDRLMEFIDSPIIDSLCNNIRGEIYKKWDYSGCPEYHMDENAIDGLARDMIMRLLCIEEMSVYSLNPGNEEYKKVYKVDNDKFIKKFSPWKVNLICAQGFCHYSAFV